MAFLDARYMVVANGLSDSLVDHRPPGVQGRGDRRARHRGPRADRARLRRPALAPLRDARVGERASTRSTSTTRRRRRRITPAGSIPTSWWPTAVAVDPPTAPSTSPPAAATARRASTSTATTGRTSQGSVQAVPFMDATALAARPRRTPRATRTCRATTGYPTVQCNGAPYDFPVPAKTDRRPEPAHQARLLHRAREQDVRRPLRRPRRRRRRPELILSPQYQNAASGRTRARSAPTFAHMDNYYSDAEQIDPGPLLGRLRAHDRRRRATLARHVGPRRVRPGALAGRRRRQRAARGQHLLGPAGAAASPSRTGGARRRPRLQELRSGRAARATTPSRTRSAAATSPARARVTCDLPRVHLRVARQRSHATACAAGVPEPRAS